MVRYLSSVGLAVSILSASSAALAQSSGTKESGLALGLRLGYALPMGKLGTAATPGTTPNTSKDDLSDTVTGMVPIWIDVGYRVNPAIYVGGFFQYGFGFVNKDNSTACNQGISCSAHDIALGANIHYHIQPAAQFDPWIGAGLGYEILGVSESGTATAQVGTQAISITVDDSGSTKGFQFLILEAGGDFTPAPDFVVGPFVSFALGQYSTYSVSGTSGGVTRSQDGDLTDTGMHEWLTIGVRGQFNL